VAISGTTAVVGARGKSGRAYMFTKTAAGWKQTAELKDSDTVRDGFGSSVAVSGTTVVVGAIANAPANPDGRAYVFTKTAAGWKQVAELTGSDTAASGDGGNGAVAGSFGDSVAISGSAAIVGAPYHTNDAGRAYVFQG